MRIKLDRSGKTLLSHQLAEWLKAAIRRGDYVDGDVLPACDFLSLRDKALAAFGTDQ